jgi:hypothetical protein
LRLFRSALLLLLLAPAALAQLDAVVAYPPGPTSETPITLAVITSCPRADTYAVQKTVNEVRLVITSRGTCPSPPIPNLDRLIPIGTLPAGSYRISYIFVGGDDIVRQIGTINVRNASSPAPFDIHPFTVRTTPAGLRLRVSRNDQSNLALCATADCSDITIRVGGVVAQNVRRTAAGEVWFDAPPHAAGLVDVVIEKRNPVVTWTYPAALFYFDSPELDAFERILFPVLFNAPGANGSDWRSEAVISNPNPFFIENYNSIESFVCVTFPCGERLSPGAYTRVSGGDHPHGVTLLVPRPEADDVAFSLRVRDLSRQAEGFGTEIPVVREKDLVMDRDITLLDVPVDPRYRVKLRVYSYEPLPGMNAFATVSVMNPISKALLTTHHLPMKRDCTDCPSMPFYAELDLPAAAAGEPVALYIQTAIGTPSWAFATVTNNTTQQVTIVTPAGGSGRPCNPCEVP